MKRCHLLPMIQPQLDIHHHPPLPAQDFEAVDHDRPTGVEGGLKAEGYTPGS